MFEQAATEHPDVTFAKVNTDVEQELAGALGIRSIPTLMVFREKVLLFSQPGALSGGQLRELLTKIKKWTWKRSTRKSPPRRTARTPDPAAPFRKSKALHGALFSGQDFPGGPPARDIGGRHLKLGRPRAAR